MKKYVNKLKRIVAVILSMALVISLFQSDILRTFADENATTPVLDFVPEGATLEENKMNTPYPVAYVKNNEITLYADFSAGAQGAVYTGAQGEQIDLANSYTYTAGDEKVILYKYEYHEIEGVMYNARNEGYMFISAEDISYTEVEKPETTPAPTPEVTASPEITPNPTPEVIPTATPGATQAPEGETITLDFVPNDPYANSAPATEKYAVINDTTIRVYKSPDYQAEGVELTVNAGTVIELVTAYTYSDGQVVYRYDYNGVENSALYNAALSELSGYPIIPAKYITEGVKTTGGQTKVDEKTGVSVEGSLPIDVQLTVTPTQTSDLEIDTTEYGIGENSLFYDVTLISGGADYQPTNGITVTFAEDKIPFGEGASYYAFHIHEDDVEKTGPFVYEGGSISVDLSGLSYVGLAEDEKTFNFEELGEITKTELNPEQKGVFVGDSITLYDSVDTDSVQRITVEGLAGKEISVFYKITFADSSLVLYQYYMVDDTDALYDTIKDYTLVAKENVDFTTSDVPSEEEIVYDYEKIMQAGTVSDYEKFYEIAVGYGTVDYFTDEQKAELESIKNTLEEMAAATTNWTEFELKANIIADGVKVYRNPVTRPNDFVLATVLEPMAEDETESEIEEIAFSETNIIGKYTADNGNTYFIVNTDTWEVFDGRVPYRYILQSDVVISEKWTKIDSKGCFEQDRVFLFTESEETSECTEITDGLSRGTLEIIYEIIKTDYAGVQEKWYLIDVAGLISKDTYTAFVKETDIKLFKTLTDSTGVSVIGDIPEGATLSVSTVSATDTEVAAGIYVIGENSLFYDVTLLDTNGNKTQPGKGGITVTFPESAVLDSGLAVGDKYHVYHVHDGVTDISEIKTYNGGDIDMTFSSLSAIGIAENEITIDLTEAEILSSAKVNDYYYDESIIKATINSDTIYIYDGCSYGAYGYHITGVKGFNISLEQYVEYESGKAFYRYYYDVDSTDATYNADFNSISSRYCFIPAEYISRDGEASDNEAVELYNKLMATETVEEWYDISANYSDEEWQVFLESLSEEENVTLTNHFDNLPTFFDKTVQESFDALLETTTVEEFDNLYKSLYKGYVDEFTFVQRIGLFQYRLELLIKEAIDNPEDYEFPGGSSEAFTNAAPFNGQSALSVQSEEQIDTYASSRVVQMFNGYKINTFAVSEEDTYDPVATYSNGALVLSKTAIPSETEGVYTITLEAYAKGEVTTTQNVTPIDITLVLDVSGSMKYCMVCGEEVTEHNNTHEVESEVTYEEYKYNQNTYKADDEYYYLSDGQYKRVYYCTRGDSSHKGWYTSSKHDSHRDKITSQIYKKTSSAEESCTVRMNALEDAVKQFIDSTKAQNDLIENADDKHRIAIVKFASDYETTIGNTFNEDDYNDSQIVQQLTTVTADNYDGMKTTVENFSPAGATRIDYGMRHAKSIVAGQENSGRTQVVIVFTDGTPTDFNGFKVSVADDALEYAEDIKTAGATVYTISVANGAAVNAGQTLPSFPDLSVTESTYQNYLGSTSVNCTQSPRETITDNEMFGLMNRFMHLISSNNPTANNLYAGPIRDTITENGITYTPTGQKETVDGQEVWSSYYLVPTNADDLTSIFGQISDQVSGSTDVTLDSEAKVTDIVTPYFNIPDGVNGVTVQTVECTGFSGDTPQWAITATDLARDKISLSNNTLDVSGFDFATNFVSAEGRSEADPNAEGSFHGKKLVISFDVKLDEFFLGGNGVQTNGSKSLITDKTGTQEFEFKYPDVDVALVDLAIDWNDQFIYITNAADLDTLFKDATVTSRYDDTKTETLAKVLDGDNNAYVDIVFTVKEKGGDVVGTYTVKAGNSLDEVGVVEWDLSAGKTLTPLLDQDTVYELTWTITPTDTTGTAQAVNHNTPVEATVYVFNPKITFDDTGLYYDGVTTVRDFSKNYVSHTWVGSINYDADIMHDYDSSSTVNRKVPGLSYTYTPENEGVTTEDTYVNVTVVTTDSDKPRTLADSEVSFIHNDCNSENFDETKGEFIVHIFTPSVEFKDSNVYLGAAEPTDFKSNTGTISWANPNGITGVEMLNDIPSTSITYAIVNKSTYISNDVITSASDIPVRAMVKAGVVDITAATNITHEFPCSAITDCTYTQPTDDSHHFVMHVFTPVLTFQDSKVNYGEIVPNYNDVNYVSDDTIWKHGTTTSDSVTMTGTAPTLTLSYTPESGGTAPAKDFYVDVAVTVGTADITEMVTFVHAVCNLINKCPFNASNGKFIVHISSLPLTIKKEFAIGTTPQVGETFIFTVKGEEGTATKDVDMTVTLVAKKDDRGQIIVLPITINSLPIGNYTVTEDMAWSWRYTVVEKNGETGYKEASAVKTVDLGEVQTVTFINQAKNSKWIDSNAYCENAFASAGTLQGVVIKDNVSEQ